MRNGNSALARGLFLALSLVLSAGCDSGSPSADAAREGVRQDAKRHRVWTLTREGVLMRDAANPSGVTLSLPGWTWAGAPYGCPPDLALGPKGEVVVTSDVLPVLWRLDPQTLVVSVHEPVLNADTRLDAGFTGLAYWARHGAYYATRGGSLWRIDAQLRTAHKVMPAAPAQGPVCASNANS